MLHCHCFVVKTENNTKELPATITTCPQQALNSSGDVAAVQMETDSLECLPAEDDYSQHCVSPVRGFSERTN